MKRFGFFILIAWVALTFVMLDTLPAPEAWSQWPADYCRGVNCYCEPIRDRLVAQPVATYSNVGFMLAGVYIIFLTLRTPLSHTNLMRAQKGYGVLYGAAIACTGLFSFFYHASLTKVGDFFDLTGMFLFTSFLALYGLTRIRPMSGVQFVVSYGVVNAALGVGLVVAYGLQQVYFLVLIAIALIAETLYVRGRKPNIKLRFMGLALLTFAAGGTVWVLDGSGLLGCDPTAPFTWHGVWHLAAAGAALLMYLYYRSEGVEAEATQAEERMEEEEE